VWNEVGLWKNILCIEGGPSAGSNNQPLTSDGEIIITETENKYEAIDSKYPHELFSYGALREDGYISINLQTKAPNGMRNPNFRGATEFNKIMSKFAPRAKGVRTTLERDNWNTFTDFMNNNPNANLVDGVKATGAYKRMVAAGFDHVEVLQYVPEYEVLEVIFSRGAK
jgi:hypothetical protein